MRTITAFPHAVRLIDPLWIAMADGARLAARIWLPENAARSPVPAILEYLPYRLRDGTALRDEATHRYLAGHGYACVRVDMRGTGDSDGVLRDEYLAQEQDDALAVIAWLALQPWCSGAVGMMGISWGGFNALQVAMRRPPALKAIVTVAASDDRYGGDTHYMGGCLLGGNLGWGAAMTALLTLPPDPDIVGERWRALWRERLDNLPLLAGEWLRHPLRDAYWRHGSVCEDYGAIECAVYAVGGWEDPYRNAIPRLIQHLKAPVKALIGPWAHHYPHLAHLAPMGFLQEILRWWDYWLKGLATGIMAEPRLRLWLQDGVRPAPLYRERPGRWIAEDGWPPASLAPLTLYLNAHTLDHQAFPEACLSHGSSQWLGAAAGTWCPYGYAAEMPGDQREDDGGSLCFASAPLEERLEVVGAPTLTVTLACDRPRAFLCARLCEVFPDGASTRVSYGLLNLSHRASHDEPSALEPGRRYAIRLDLNPIAHAFLPGNRIRLALSTSYWPTVWPAPEAALIHVYSGAGSRLALPVRQSALETIPLAPFLEPEAAATAHLADEVEAADRRFTIERDIAAERQTTVVHRNRGRLRFRADGLDVSGQGVERYSIRREDPLSARCETRWTLRHERGPWRVRTEMETILDADLSHFHLLAQARAYEGDHEFARRDYDLHIPRFPSQYPALE